MARKREDKEAEKKHPGKEDGQMNKSAEQKLQGEQQPQQLVATN